MARHSFSRVNPIDCLKELRGKVLGTDISATAMGCMLFSQDGVIVTDDIEDEFIPENNPPIVVETRCSHAWAACLTSPKRFDMDFRKIESY